MFFYISFLRPPPCQAAPYSNIVIAPQIANDLRTESFEGSQDIFYLWSQEHPPQKIPNATRNPDPIITTSPRKLTTWRQANAYKEIPVPTPPNVREGQYWRLLLTGTQANAQKALEIDLADGGVGRHPFPVMSMPILFTARCGKGAQKQEYVERVYRFPRAESDDGKRDNLSVDLKITEQTSFDLDKKIWDSGIGLSSWLVGLYNRTNSDSDSAAVKQTRDALFSSERRTILELGAGTGLVAIAIAAFRSASNAADNIIATDVSSAMPLLEQNISNNQHTFRTSPKAVVLDWDDEDLPLDVAGLEDGLDTIVMADVTYNTASFPSLIRTLDKLLRLGSQPPAILLGYKERDAAERTLWDMAAEIGVEFEKVGERVGAGGAPVEIWIGHLRQ